MSTVMTDYVILGFDLTSYIDDIYTEEWRTDENMEKWESNQSKGHIQLFPDPMSGCYLYFGYIVSVQDGYEDNIYKLDLSDRKYIEKMYDKTLDALIESKLISKQVLQTVINGTKMPFEVICFTEYR